MSPSIRRKLVRFLMKQDELTLEDIKQFLVDLDKEDWKLFTLFDLYEAWQSLECHPFEHQEKGS